MGKLVKAIIVLAVIVGAIAIAAHYINRSRESSTNAGKQESSGPKVQVQEKYGIASVGEDE